MYIFRFLGRILRSIWAASEQPPPVLPQPPSADDPQSKIEYERRLEDHSQKKETRQKRHEETSLTIRRIYYAILTVAIFCFSALHGRKDVAFISTTSNVKLPLVDIPVSFSAFLIVGPSVIIGLTAYVHIFLGEHFKIAVDREDRIPTVFNMDGMAARVVSQAIFYWLPPITLFYFAWKARSLLLDGPLLLATAAAAALTLFLLQLWRLRRNPAAAAFVSIGFLVALITFSLIYRQSDQIISLKDETIIGQNLTIMNLVGASLEGATITKGDLNAIDLSNAIFTDAEIAHSEFNGSNLSDAHFDGAMIVASRFNGSNLSRANFAGATLSDVELSHAILIGARLSNATLIDGTRLDSAKLSGAFLDGSDLSGALELKASQLDGACGDSLTRLPVYFIAQNPEFRLRRCVPQENEIKVGEHSLTARIDPPDEQREFTFRIQDEGVYQIDVTGQTSEAGDIFDPTMTLRGPNLESDLLDDDGGSDLLDSRIISRLMPGLYTLIVEEYDKSTGSFVVAVDAWDRRSTQGLGGTRIPESEDIPLNIAVDKNNPDNTTLVPPNAEDGLTWIALESIEDRTIVISARFDDAEADIEAGELVLLLFDADAGYTPIASGNGNGDQTIRCGLGLKRYLILLGSFIEQRNVDLTVSLQGASPKDSTNDCSPN